MPESIFSKPEIHLRNVVFPLPLSPRNDIISPRLTEKSNFLIIGFSFLYDLANPLTSRYIDLFIN